jgi:hypothetical protein
LTEQATPYAQQLELKLQDLSAQEIADTDSQQLSEQVLLSIWQAENNYSAKKVRRFCDSTGINQKIREQLVDCFKDYNN